MMKKVSPCDNDAISGVIGKTVRDKARHRSSMYCTGEMSSRNRPEWISMAISQNEISEQARVLSCNAVSMAA